ncbi:phosphoglycolate phosphatase [Aquibaculum sediminis]|uniref:phosphoglycolate phosphatase n=1 Tax=Aquibaculum sediminis TaxID=3231907 RepID=UPI0034527CCF
MTSIIFDLDGTLIDSAPDIHAGVAKLLQEEGLAPLDLATVQSFIGNGVPVLIERVMQHCFGSVDPARRDSFIERFMAHYNAAPTALTRLYPGVKGALIRLQDDGHAIGLCTNKPAAISKAILAGLDVAQHFRAIIGGDSVGAKKPDPAPLHAAVEALGGGAAIYVGDSEIDATAAAAAGLPFLLFTEGYRKRPAAEIAHLASFADFQGLPALIDAVAGELRAVAPQ